MSLVERVNDDSQIIEEVNCTPEKDQFSSALVPVSLAFNVSDNLPALNKSDKNMSLEMDTLFKNF